MAKLFDTADAERLIQEHRMMLEELDEIAQYEDNVQIDIEKAANLVVTRNVLDVLRDIPVEEINREKGGFRVKALRDHGFRSIADIVAANVYSISSVHGISEDAAYSIKRIANDIFRFQKQLVTRGLFRLVGVQVDLAHEIAFVKCALAVLQRFNLLLIFGAFRYGSIYPERTVRGKRCGGLQLLFQRQEYRLFQLCGVQVHLVAAAFNVRLRMAAVIVRGFLHGAG